MRKVQWGPPDQQARLEIREQLARQAEMERLVFKGPRGRRAQPARPGLLGWLVRQERPGPGVRPVPLALPGQPAHVVIRDQQEHRALLARRE
ncbi:hypothetical protein [Methylobacterium variabile]|uniref:hypothetical protein n=1 Tax=Methylobacterium variabile TaxID=298794 RepID=UPI00065483BF|nr:hypothetical protein [Methylobacterium variabile]